jgi:hypothetical protein
LNAIVLPDSRSEEEDTRALEAQRSAAFAKMAPSQALATLVVFEHKQNHSTKTDINMLVALPPQENVHSLLFGG